MKVNKIIEYACIMLDKGALLASPIFHGEGDSDHERKSELNSILQCVNYTILKIVSQYKPLTACVTVSGQDQVCLSKITGHTIQNILSITASSGESVAYKIVGNKIVMPTSRDVTIKYSYFPSDVTFGEELDFFVEDIHERVVALSVVADYYFSKGIMDEMERFDTEFQNVMCTLTRKKAEIYIKPRRWV